MIFDARGRLIVAEGANAGGGRRVSITERDGTIRTLADATRASGSTAPTTSPSTATAASTSPTPATSATSPASSTSRACS